MRSHSRPHRKCSIVILCMPMESWTLRLIRQCRNRIAIQSGKGRHHLTEMCTHRRPKTPRKILITSFGEVSCLVAIAFAKNSPKVNVTASKQVPGREELGS